MSVANSTKPAFESMEDEDGTGTAEAAPAASAPASTQTAVAVQRPAGVMTAADVMKKGSLVAYKDAFPVDWDSCPAIAAGQGQLFNKAKPEDKLGTEITFQMMSYQEQWVASPNDDKADIETVKYSNDGVTSVDGINLAEHIKMLQEGGWTKAKIVHRLILVGELVAVKDKPAHEGIGQLWQINMPDTGRRSYNAYSLQAAFKIGKGLANLESAAKLKIIAQTERSKDKKDYTKFVIAQAV